MLIVGLTGGIATGKSTVSRELASQGLPIIDADLIAREVVEPGTTGYKKVLKAFSDVPDLTNADGTLNRPVLGKAVFGKPDKLKILNGIVHGAVKREICRQLLVTYIKGYSMAILDVPLLFETGLNWICGRTVNVSVDASVQLRRLMDRNPELSEEDAKKRIASQLSTRERNRMATHIIDNSGDLASLHNEVESLLATIKPSPLVSALEWFPPIGLSVAAMILIFRSIRYFLYKSSDGTTKERATA